LQSEGEETLVAVAEWERRTEEGALCEWGCRVLGNESPGGGTWASCEDPRCPTFFYCRLF
jgi:hypothetical protein